MTNYTPFGTPINPEQYEDEYAQEYTKDRIDELRNKLRKCDEQFDKYYDSDDDYELFGTEEPSTSSVPQNQQQSTLEKSPSKRARFLSTLVDQVVEAGNLLLTDDGKAFAYEEGSGCFRPVSKLERYLANFFRLRPHPAF